MVGGIISESNKPGPVSWVLGRADLGQLITAIEQCSEAVVDLETTGLREHAWTGGPQNGGVAARIALASFTLPARIGDAEDEQDWDGNDPTTYVLPLSHPDSPWLGNWKSVLARALREVVDSDRPLANANVKFDAKWVYALTGVDLAPQIVWDTQVSSHLLDENASTKLKERAPATFGIPPWDDHDLSYPGAAEEIPLFELGDYAARDTYWTWRLKREHRERMFLEGPHVADGPQGREEVEDARLGKLATWVAMPTVASLTRIEQRGMKLDVPWVEQKLEEDERTARESLARMADLYGLDPAKASTAPTSLWFREFTTRAVEAGDLIITAFTETNQPQWSKGVLNRQARSRPDGVAQLILTQRQAAKRAEYLRSWLGFVTREGFIHTTYWPGRVVTGRLSSEAPNMQQVTKSLRPAFIPREGYYMVDLDYSQLELRVAAFISRSATMLEAFAEGADLHRMLAAKTVGCSMEEVTGEQRGRAKPANFGLLYGMSALSFREYAEDVYGVVLTEREALEFHTAFFELWTGLREWHERQIATVHRTGQVVSPLGRVRRLPGVFDGNPRLVGHAERISINAPVQGFGSDLMQMAAASIQGLLPGSTAIDRLPLVATVHDSIVGEVPIDNWQEYVAEAQDRMEHLDRVLARMDVTFDVPLVADASVGTRWGLDDISNPPAGEAAA